jgi:hypothetical protein
MCNNSEIGLSCNDRAQTTSCIAQLGSRILVQHTLVDVVVHNTQYLVPISGNEVTVQFPPGDIRGVHESAVIQT